MNDPVLRDGIALIATSHGDELPAGTQPNWYNHRAIADGDLVSRFRLALKVLEALLYVFCGAVADYTGARQWWANRRSGAHPRCLWPEQVTNWEDETGAGSYYYQTAATGRHFGLLFGEGVSNSDTGYIDWARTTPIALQWDRTTHAADYFPAGSVSIAPAASEYGDPTSTSPTQIRWSVPEAKRASVTSVELILLIAGDEISVAMSSDDAGETYHATVPPQADKTGIRFCLCVTTSEAERGTIYEPHGATEGTQPTWFDYPEFSPDNVPETWADDQGAGSSYGYYVLDHAAPYRRGLPELYWEACDGEKRAGLKRCTGFWRFDETASIEPGLINVARFALDWLGAQVQHHPGARGNDQNCCFDMPIRFRWSGSNRYAIYRSGGKASATSPLTNNPADSGAGGDAASRRTWRGLPPQVLGEPGTLCAIYGARRYGGDESWLSWPLGDEYVSLIDSPFDEWYPGYFPYSRHNCGLREGDVIDAIHLEEIVEAVDYLVANGLWRVEPVPVCGKTPLDTWPWESGYGRCAYTYSQTFPYDPEIYYSCDADCGWSDPDDPCQDAANYLDNLPPAHPKKPWDKPPNADCCRMPVVSGSANPACGDAHVSPGACGRHVTTDAQCNHPGWGEGDKRIEHGCESASSIAENSVAMDCHQSIWPGKATQCNIHARVKGWSAWVCPPYRSLRGVGDGLHGNGMPMWSFRDSLHGNGWSKNRSRMNASTQSQTTASMGNNFDLVVACDQAAGGVRTLSFEEIVGVDVPTPVPDWIRALLDCQIHEMIPPTRWLFAPVPGYGYYGPSANGVRPPLCTASEIPASGLGSTWYTAESCEFNPTFGVNCQPVGGALNAYHRVRLNLVNGIPTLDDYELGMVALNDDGTVHLHDGRVARPDTVIEAGERTITEGNAQCPCYTAI